MQNTVFTTAHMVKVNEFSLTEKKKNPNKKYFGNIPGTQMKKFSYVVRNEVLTFSGSR